MSCKVPDAVPQVDPAPDVPAALDPLDVWPLSGLVVRQGDLELRYPDDAMVHEIAAVASRGIHGPDEMPFGAPWSVGEPSTVARAVLRRQWAARSNVSPQGWRIELAVVRDGEVLGVQSIFAQDFVVQREAVTGSWLGIAHHGRGLGTRMRLMVLALGFDGLGAEQMSTAAWGDNASSLAVTRKVGYRENGRGWLDRAGERVADLRFRLDRADWAARLAALDRSVEAHGEIELLGVERVRSLLGLA